MGAEALRFDACSRVTNKDEYGIGETEYEYDAEGQLTDVDYPSGASHEFTYDDNGNRTQWTRTDGPTTTYAYNAADQLTQSTEGTIGTTYTHDDNGNMTGETTGGVTKSFNYDAFNRLTSVTEGLASIQSMTYGPDGKRLSLTDSSGTRKFFYDGNDVIQEYNSDWSSVRMEYTHGPWVDEPLSMTDHASREASDTHYLMKDRLGSIINILDENETVKTTYSYDAFGDPTATYHAGQVDCMYRFTGRIYDGAMGNYFYRARYYNQSLGRFFSRDPIMSLQSLYAYCNNSPANFTDPSGMVYSDDFQGQQSVGYWTPGDSAALPPGPGPDMICAGVISWIAGKVKNWINNKANAKGKEEGRTAVAVRVVRENEYETVYNDNSTGEYDPGQHSDLPVLRTGGSWWNSDDVIGYTSSTGVHYGDKYSKDLGDTLWMKHCYPIIHYTVGLEATIFVYKALQKGLKGSYGSSMYYSYGASGDFDFGLGDSPLSSFLSSMGLSFDSSSGRWRFDPSSFQFDGPGGPLQY
ncbi:MAG: hypothetical protein JW941_00785 [Candidatus Coatesbacteria bacterium]|nr:hypothetical protein [Candidatus Coatesbacteria bacterium]